MFRETNLHELIVKVKKICVFFLIEIEICANL